MKLILKTPTQLRIQANDSELVGLQNILKYKDKSIEHLMMKMKKNFYFEQRHGRLWVQQRLDEYQKQLYKSLFYQDSEGFYTLSGLEEAIKLSFPDCEFENHVIYPEFKLIPWSKKPEHDPREFQLEAVERLLANPHSHIQVATGLGKSYIAVLLAKATGLPTVISTPSQSIAKQLYKELTLAFGKKMVGLFGAGKKEVGKHILVAVGKSLSLVKPEEFGEFEKYKVLISDESHTLPANQFSYFCLNVLGHCPYRWSLSATQERNDGRDLLLEGIIGPRVYEKTIQSGMSDNLLAKLSTLIFNVQSSSDYVNANAMSMNQKHFYENQSILDIICMLVPDAIKQGLPTLILVDQHYQEEMIRKRIGEIYAYAKGGSDTSKICDDFNAGKIMCVIGTSAVSVGTNFKPVKLTINWQGGKAETRFKQGVIGRSTRMDEASGKTSCRLVDFRVINIPMMKRHADARIKLYKQVGEVSFLDY